MLKDFKDKVAVITGAASGTGGSVSYSVTKHAVVALTEAGAKVGISRQKRVRERLAAGMAPTDLAGIVFAAIRAQRSYILTHEDFDQMILQRTGHVAAGTKPDLPVGV